MRAPSATRQFCLLQVRKTTVLACEGLLTVVNLRARLDLDKSSGVDGHKATTATISSSQILDRGQLGRRRNHGQGAHSLKPKPKNEGGTL